MRTAFRTSERPRPCVTSEHYRALLRSNYIGMHATVLYRRETLERHGGFDTSLSASEDYDLYLRMARQGPWSVTPRSSPNIDGTAPT